MTGDASVTTTAGGPAVDPGSGVPEQRLPSAEDVELVERLRTGDEDAFARIVLGWSPMMLRVARGHVSTDASCEEVVQETWMAVVRGLDAFEGRSSLRTWVFRILTNLAKTRGVREARSVPLSSLVNDDETGPTVDPDRFQGPGERHPQHWSAAGRPEPWVAGPEQSAVDAETRRLLGAALRELPARQRTVVSLRDVQGLASDEVCALLGISAANQRVLLHRGRARLRTALEHYYRGTGEARS